MLLLLQRVISIDNITEVSVSDGIFNGSGSGFDFVHDEEDHYDEEEH
jgi:hypothetical protein